MANELKKHLSRLGKIGGLSKSPKKILSSLANLKRAEYIRALKKQINLTQSILEEGSDLYEALFVSQQKGSWTSDVKECKMFKAFQLRAWSRCRQLRMKIARAKGTHTKKEWEDLLKKSGNKCLNCRTPEKLTKDHIVAIYKGGSDSIENIQVLCARCNILKFIHTVKY